MPCSRAPGYQRQKWLDINNPREQTYNCEKHKERIGSGARRTNSVDGRQPHRARARDGTTRPRISCLSALPPSEQLLKNEFF